MANGSFQLGNIPSLPAIPMPSLGGDISSGISSFLSSLEENRRVRAAEAARQAQIDIQREQAERQAEAQAEQTLNTRRLLETAQGREARDVAERQRELEEQGALAAFYKQKYGDLANSPDAVAARIGAERDEQARALELVSARGEATGSRGLTPSSIMSELARIRSRRQQLFRQREEEIIEEIKRKGAIVGAGGILSPQEESIFFGETKPQLTATDTSLVDERLGQEFPLSSELVGLLEGGEADTDVPEHGERVAKAIANNWTPREIIIQMVNNEKLDQGAVLRALEWAQRLRR